MGNRERERERARARASQSLGNHIFRHESNHVIACLISLGTQQNIGTRTLKYVQSRECWKDLVGKLGMVLGDVGVAKTMHDQSRHRDAIDWQVSKCTNLNHNNREVSTNAATDALDEMAAMIAV
jgi:hypothetical protein